jgi:hypothetical protein
MCNTFSIPKLKGDFKISIPRKMYIYNMHAENIYIIFK